LLSSRRVSSSRQPFFWLQARLFWRAFSLSPFQRLLLISLAWSLKVPFLAGRGLALLGGAADVRASGHNESEVGSRG
jgi:hypothetical protein